MSSPAFDSNTLLGWLLYGGGGASAQKPNSSSASTSTTASTNNPLGYTSGQLGEAALGESIPGLALGLYQMFSGQKSLNDLDKTPYPLPTIGGELQGAYNEAAGNSNVGLDVGQRASFNNDINRATATNVSNAERLGGNNLASTVRNISNADQLTAYDKLASLNAEEIDKHRQQYYMMADEMQKQRNVISTAAMARRDALEQSYGGMLQSGTKNVVNSAASLGMLLPLL